MEEEWRKSWLDFRRGGGIAGVTLTVARHNCKDTNTYINRKHWQKDPGRADCFRAAGNIPTTTPVRHLTEPDRH